MSRGAASALAAALALTAGLGLAGCSAAAPELKVDGAFMPQPVSDMAGGFLTLVNEGGAADRLTSVTSSLSDDVELHEAKDGKMRQVTSLAIPANGELHLERGGDHLMFLDIKKQPKQGEEVDVELHFEKSEPIRVQLPVKDRTHNPDHH
ncbi:copper chaperone PCu(A)C [Streptomyces spongiicola]|uniref:Copper chaperone PCu(A)C n=1 Tax=Streptomyces spongiicola TaxID=1690221 RepID=A0A2S1Z134_9ACTN|nr:copper chaperone PCu(A)C [Streptomyces spongiicola]AWK10055.1 copper resistance protein CopZ [Streptomyces spongiicola]GBQ00997.1 copper chaperone PCu(A)C [Streptomyces spongiicola]